MACKAEWSIPKLEEGGFPKKDAVLSFHWGLPQRGSAWDNDSGAGTRTSEFSVVRNVDSSSPILFQECAGGSGVPLVTVYLERVEGRTTVVYATFTFESCFITSIRPSHADGDNPLEDVSLNFE